MLVLITKASEDYWYEFKEVDTVEDLLKINDTLVIEPNRYRYDVEDTIKYWDGFKKEDIPKMKKAKINITIYDDYIE